ncbi:RNA polymerase sigma-70 factor, ECF family [Rhodovulum sp. P5]|uniref:RNA polymerase sigma factor n=1 Tax=Rhodovulum sp. P5 TaxID=1564506 RepID=UPI0009C34724|nr:RNA polymerase sigma factor [Rhodovulum sp. P5]ARE39622.1 RNA polymerase sigma-70 factor, ECF family [Rhodovulum sp. P5]
MDMPFDAVNESSDEELLTAYGRGDARAARVLTMRLTPWVLSYAARLTGDRAEAEDVAQEAMLRLWRVAPDWRVGEAKVTTWLYRVVTNLCTDRLRRRRGQGLDEVPEPPDDAPGAEARLQQAARVDALQQALGTLPARQRQAVVLRHVEGLANPEIAEIMEISTEAVESLTARGKRALAAALAPRRQELGFEDD